jgi:hypothetical protein
MGWLNKSKTYSQQGGRVFLEQGSVKLWHLDPQNLCISMENQGVNLETNLRI